MISPKILVPGYGSRIWFQDMVPGYGSRIWFQDMVPSKLLIHGTHGTLDLL